jgi:hypothetical protein
MSVIQVLSINEWYVGYGKVKNGCIEPTWSKQSCLFTSQCLPIPPPDYRVPL